MHQFDIVENLSPLTRPRYPYAVVLQHDRIAAFATVIVAPHTDATPALLSTRLHPEIVVAGRRFAVMIEQLAGVQAQTLGPVIASAEADRYKIIAALDLLFTGI